jgi:cytochrome c553
VRTIRVFIVFTAGLASIALVLLAQSDADYQGYMKTVAASNGKFQKGITAKDKGVIVSEGAALEGVFKQVETFWQKRSAPDAVNFAKQAHTAAAAASKAANAGNFDLAATEAKNLSATCTGCHMAHREKGDGGFKIK